MTSLERRGETTSDRVRAVLQGAADEAWDRFGDRRAVAIAAIAASAKCGPGRRNLALVLALTAYAAVLDMIHAAADAKQALDTLTEHDHTTTDHTTTDTKRS